MAMHMHHNDVVVTKTGTDKKTASMLLEWELGVPALEKAKICAANKIPFCDRQGINHSTTFNACVWGHDAHTVGCTYLGP
jgi:hypothetical protein